MKIKTRKRNSFFKEVLFEVVGEVVWNIVLFIPRMVFRLISSIW
ncbi:MULTISPECIES: hypothetical protein [Niallia]|jgi:hypothetical protein|nr:hypothetical protein [Niallia circulans]